MEYSDNLQLRTSRPRITTGAVMEAGVHLKCIDEQDRLSLSPTLQARRYNSSEPLNSNDQVLSGEWSHNSERGTWQLNGEWTRDTTLTSELEISGLVQSRKRRLRRYVSPSYSFELTPRSTLATDVSYTTVKYGDALFTGLVNYKYGRADLNMSYQWSELSSLTGTVYASRLEASQISNRTYTGGVQLQISTTLSERWDGVFGAGMYRTHGNGDNGGANGGLIDLRLNRKDDLGAWHADINRSVDPSGTGILVQRDQWSISRELRFTDLWYGSVSGYWIVNKDLQKVAINQDRHYRAASLRLRRKLSPEWSLGATYSYGWQRYAMATDSAERDIVELSVHYSEQQEAE